jgi:hypothetical protein
MPGCIFNGGEEVEVSPHSVSNCITFDLLLQHFHPN